MRVVVGGGVALFRRALVQQLTALGVVVADQVTHVAGVGAAVDRHPVDAVLLDVTGALVPSAADVRTPSGPSLTSPEVPHAATVRRLRRRHPAVGLVLLLAPGAATVRTPGLLAVAVDAVDDAADLTRALAQVTAGFAAPEATPERRQAALTPGEALVLGLLGRGYSNDGIADALGLSRKTVECHVSRIFDKLGLARAASGTNRRVLAARHWSVLAEPDQAVLRSGR